MMATIHDLSPEILNLCLEALCNDRQPLNSLRSVNLVCQRFHDTATPLLFRNVHLKVDACKFDFNSIILLEYLQSKSLCSHVLTVTLSPSEVNDLHLHTVEKPEIPIEDLISLLPSLKSIRLMPGASIPDNPRLSANALSSIPSVIPLLKAGQSNRRVNCQLKSYDYLMGPRLLDVIYCIEALDVKLIPPYQGYPHATLEEQGIDGLASKGVAKIIKRNCRLQHLGLHLEKLGMMCQSPDKIFDSEQRHALENLAEAVSALSGLRSISLSGAFHFSDQVWKGWNDVWSRLYSLHVAGHGPSYQIVTHLTGVMPSLKCLGLSPHARVMPNLHTGPHSSTGTGVIPEDIEAFIRPLSLEHLSLVECAPDTIFALENSEATLRSLCLHGPPEFQGRPPQFPQIKYNILTSAHLKWLASRCHSLDWLAIDVEPFHLSSSTSNDGHKIPVSGWSKQVQDRLKEASSMANLRIPDQLAALQELSMQRRRIMQLQQVTRPLPQQIGAQQFMQAQSQQQRPLPQMQQPALQANLQTRTSPTFQTPEPDMDIDNIFPALLSLHALRHLRLYVSSNRLQWAYSSQLAYSIGASYIPICEAIHTFLYLRAHKKGCKLESLVVYNADVKAKSGKHSCHTIYGLDDGKVCVSEGKTQQIWKLDVNGKLALIERRYGWYAGYSEMDNLGKPRNGMRFPSEWAGGWSHDWFQDW